MDYFSFLHHTLLFANQLFHNQKHYDYVIKCIRAIHPAEGIPLNL